MPLPVLNIPARRSDADLLRLFCRTELLRSDSLAEQTALETGTALTNRNLPNIAAANRMLDAAIPAGSSAEQSLAEVADHFSALGVSCLEIWPNSTQPNEPLAMGLCAAGFVPHTIDVYSLHSPTRPADEPRPDLSVYSARAGLRHARALIEAMTADSPFAEQETEAMLLQLDDPHYELFLASEAGGGGGVGMIALFAAGDIGRIDSLFVRPSHRRRGIGRLLLSRAIELAARSRFADLLLSFSGSRRVGVLAHHSPTAESTSESICPALFHSAGFRPIGAITAYRLLNGAEC